MMSSDAEKLSTLIQTSINDGSFRKAVLSKPASKAPGTASRIDVRKVLIKKKPRLQFTYRIGNQEQHRNFDFSEAIVQLTLSVGIQFRDISLWTDSEEWTARHSRKGVCALKKQTGKPKVVDKPDHNRTRQYLIPEGKPVPFLVQTGIMMSDGKVKSKHYHKFRQINRFIEFVRDVSDHLPADDVIQVVDFGCGKSYLTFATHYFFTQILSRSVEIVGLDRREDVVGQCRQITADLKLSGLRFAEGDIAGYRPTTQVHLAISLHACDTATDDALAVAAAWQANVIMAVPCCQHELASKLAKDQVPVFSEHGILHEKFSSLATDAIRANLLECVGYKTQVLEFIDTEHTPKNLLIRSIRRQELSSEPAQKDWNDRMRTFSGQLGLPPLRLQRKLEEYGLLTPANAK